MKTRDELSKYQDFKFDSDLVSSSIRIGDNQNYFIYKQHKEYLPYVGDLYGSKYPKMLLVLESHYLEPKDRDKVLNVLNEKYNFESDSIKHFAEAWYFNQDNSWSKFETKIVNKHFYNTRSVIIDVMEGKNTNNVIADVLNVFDEVNKEINGTVKQEKEGIRNFAFMNFFQRPEINTGKSIKHTKFDVSVAKENLNNVINILKPDKVIFVSIKSYNIFSYKNDEIKSNENIIRVSQPGCKYWNIHEIYNKCYLENCFRDWIRE